jgi:hypothetical protein
MTIVLTAISYNEEVAIYNNNNNNNPWLYSSDEPWPAEQLAIYLFILSSTFMPAFYGRETIDGFRSVLLV